MPRVTRGSGEKRKSVYFGSPGDPGHPLAWVAEHLKAQATRRTTLPALVVSTGNDAYRLAMLANAAQVQVQYAKSVTTPERKEHLLS